MSGKMAPIGQITGLRQVISLEPHIKYDKNHEGQFLKNLYFPMAFYSCFQNHRHKLQPIAQRNLVCIVGCFFQRCSESFITMPWDS